MAQRLISILEPVGGFRSPSRDVAWIGAKVVGFLITFPLLISFRLCFSNDGLKIRHMPISLCLCG